MRSIFDKSDKKIMLYGVVAVITTFLAAILRTVCLFFYFDAPVGYYTQDLLPSILGGFCVASILFFMSALFVVKEDLPTSDGREVNIGIKIASLVCFFSLVFFFMQTLMSDSYSSDIFNTFIKILALVSVFFFVMNVFDDGKHREIQAFFGFAVIIFGIIIVVRSYFDITTLSNGPDKVNLHLSMSAFLLFLVNELRAFVGKIKKGFYVFSLSAAVFLCGSTAIPSIVFRIANYGFEYANFSLDLIIASFAVYCFARLASFVVRTERESIQN